MAPKATTKAASSGSIIALWIDECSATMLENYPHYTRTKSSLFLSLRAVLSQMYIGMKHALLAGTRALHYDTLS